MDEFTPGVSQLDLERRKHPTRLAAQGRGCTCRWHGWSSIIAFNPDCPILREHRPDTLPSTEPPFHGEWARAVDREITGLAAIMSADLVAQVEADRADHNRQLYTSPGTKRRRLRFPWRIRIERR